MGLYDREYSRETAPGFHVSAPTTATIQIILITAAVYVVQIISPSIENFLSLHADWFRRPWEFYTLVTYGVLHSTENVWHIIGNMFGLWLFGQDVEYRYGRRRFITFYVAAMVVAGLVWSLCQNVQGYPPVQAPYVIGASGATTAVLILFAFNFPHRQILFMFVIPMPVWLLGVIIVVQDAVGAVQRMGEVAFTAHLAGAAFALLFFKTGWLPGGALVERGKWPRFRRRPKLRVHEPSDDPEDELQNKVDAILAKVSAQGIDSLSWSERRTLEKASRQFQQRRK